MSNIGYNNDLFGEKIATFKKSGRSQEKNDFFDYEGFVDKFKHKKTTDDCYTPAPVYNAIIEYLKETNVISNNEKIIRPFFPGNDYQRVEYNDDEVVVDNPPFSILIEIVRFYTKRNIRFFILCPHLTSMRCIDFGATFIPMNITITYSNGAKVCTSFLSSIHGADNAVICLPKLHEKIVNAMHKKSKALPKYKYPNEVLTANTLGQIVTRGEELTIKRSAIKIVKKLDHQKVHKKSIFGDGALVSEDTAKRINDILEEIEQSKFYWQLSSREVEIIKSLHS